MVNGKEYRDRVSVVEQNMKFFKRSVEGCNIPAMLEDSIRFLETSKNAENHFLKLPTNIKDSEKNTHIKSQLLLQEYFNIKTNIGNFCDCKMQMR